MLLRLNSSIFTGQKEILSEDDHQRIKTPEGAQ
jgi:hypothetical protein